MLVRPRLFIPVKLHPQEVTAMWVIWLWSDSTECTTFETEYTQCLLIEWLIWSPTTADSPLGWTGVLCGLRPLQKPKAMAGGHRLLCPPPNFSPVSAAAPCSRRREAGGLWHGTWSCFDHNWRRSDHDRRVTSCLPGLIPRHTPSFRYSPGEGLGTWHLRIEYRYSICR